ncbi:MAG: glycosyltransferase [Planctomycetaceae bacterium]
MIQAVPRNETGSTDTHRRSNGTIRVLHVINGEHYAGAARVQDLLAVNLPKHNCEAAFACVLPDQFGPQRICQQTPLYEFPMRHKVDLRPARRIADMVIAEGFDLIHSHETRSALIGATAARLAGVPYIHHVHCQMSTEVGPRITTRIQTQINATIERTACRLADRVIAVSGSIQRFLQHNGFNQTPVCVIPNGVPDPNATLRLRDERDPWTIGMVALLRERKGLECLLDSLALLQSADGNIRLRIVGQFESSGYERAIQTRIAELNIADRIDFTGFTRNVSHEIQQMDLLVLPSVLPEGMPMVLLEAMAAGVPVAGSRVDGITDVIRDTHNGILFDPGNPESLASQVNRLLNGELNHRTLGENARQDYLANYSDSVMAARVADVYRTVLKQRHRLHEKGC